MQFDGIDLAGLLAALGGGLLVGTERERRREESAVELPAGIRTCALIALCGALAAILGIAAIVVAGSAVVAFVMASYWHSRERDPGLTTEFALLATFLVGVLAMSHARIAAALFVLLTIILASKESLHRFTRQVLSRGELNNALLLAASALIVLPLLPNRPVDPLAVLNPRKLWLYAVLVMTINAAGHVALRAFGSRRGLFVAGLLGGFVSSAATIAGMGQRASSNASLRRGCVAAALLSNVATVVQLALILGVVAPQLLLHLAWPLSIAAAVAIALGGAATLHARGTARDVADSPDGNAFALHQALLFALMVALALFAAALLNRFVGIGGVYGTAALTGLADVHAAAVAVGQLANETHLGQIEAVRALAIAFSANSAVKCAGSAFGGAGYAIPVCAGIVLLNIAFVTTALMIPM